MLPSEIGRDWSLIILQSCWNFFGVAPPPYKKFYLRHWLFYIHKFVLTFCEELMLDLA